MIHVGKSIAFHEIGKGNWLFDETNDFTGMNLSATPPILCKFCHKRIRILPHVLQNHVHPVQNAFCPKTKTPGGR